MTSSSATGPRPLPGRDGPPERRAALAVAGVVAVVALSVAGALARPAAADVPAAPASATQASAVAPGHTTSVTVRVEGMAFSPSRIEVPAGDDLRITVQNDGDQRHDLVLANGTGTGLIAPGDRATVDVGTVTSSLDGWCSLPGHRQMGMTLEVVTTGSTDPAAERPPAPADAPSDVPTMARLQDAARHSPAYPAALPPAPTGTEHDYTFTVTEQVQQVTPRVSRAVWTYNGTSPGPMLRGHVGDTFRVTLVNHGSMGHSVDFHAGELAPDEPMRTIEPGQSLTYTFTADRAGIWMYHCSTAPISQHIANGMFGAVVIDPAGLDPVDEEYVLVQSEQYLGANGAPADPAKVATGIPDIVTFNGRAFQYDAHPLTARVGDRVRIWVLDAGPDASWSFHVVGAQFDTVWTEGRYSVRDGRATDGSASGPTGAQVLPLLAAQGGFVELTVTEPGHYAIVNHQMSLAEKGAHGVLEVTR
ncbi:multicopper oxidase domain-containing protein [Isoptericola sp. b490]|uniref:multicopper oxidase domain-containing protein n=1 Tax=Actinotalea lenta TaxID=3064654 RepID=UPI00271248FC|nr:multicopper oxidase domain-containing protein [Isoptericola sp. b490]MDO8121585.1 multicopper oxidase domain-containing protein [Isoptericola sp. b490]